MLIKLWFYLLLLTLWLLQANIAFAHPGNTDSSGGHTCRTNCDKWGYSYGNYHIHKSSSSSATKTGDSSVWSLGMTVIIMSGWAIITSLMEKKDTVSTSHGLKYNNTGLVDKRRSNSRLARIKGNINLRGEKIYHVPGQKYYEICQPEFWFSTEKEAEEAGYRKSKV